MTGAPSDRSVIVIDKDLKPIGVASACQASAIATLGVIRPVQVWCGEALGHEGEHTFRVTWTDPLRP